MLKDFFPEGYTPNAPQEFILGEIDKALVAKKKFILINAPTGSGKSFISKTVANLSSLAKAEFVNSVKPSCRWGNLVQCGELSFGTAVLTCTKSLQDQYYDLFREGSVLKGKANYRCGEDNTLWCDLGKCALDDSRKDECWKDRVCPYLNARFNAACNQCSFYSYSMFLSLPDFVKWKDFIVCDEASELEDVIVSEYTLEVDLVELMKYLGGSLPVVPDEGSGDTLYFRWLKDAHGAIEAAIREMTSPLEGRKKKKKLTKDEKRKLGYLMVAESDFKKTVEVWDETEWFKIHKEDGTVTFMPYQVDHLAHHFFKYGKTVILMSATIVNPKKYAKTLGIDDYYFIDAPSLMDPGRAFITPYEEEFRPNYRNKNLLIPRMAEVAAQLCEAFPGKKGIIHSNSFDIQRMMQNVLGLEGRYLFRRAGYSNEQLMELHRTTSEPTVLVSPSMTHGVDLKGHLGEFQIIMKAPYPNLGDPRVKRKFEEDKEWYVDKMLSTLVQACGRCNRSVDDLSITFILDRNAYDQLVLNRAKLPAYFNERLTPQAAARFKEFAKELM